MGLRRPELAVEAEGGGDLDVGTDPDAEGGFSGADYFPDELQRETVYRPTGNGFEQVVRDRVREWQRLRERKQRP